MSPFTHSLSLHLSCVSLHFRSICASVALFFSSSLISPTCQHTTLSPSSLPCTLSRISCICMCCLPVLQHLLLFSACRTVFAHYLSNPVSAAGVCVLVCEQCFVVTKGPVRILCSWQQTEAFKQHPLCKPAPIKALIYGN